MMNPLERKKLRLMALFILAASISTTQAWSSSSMLKTGRNHCIASVPISKLTQSHQLSQRSTNSRMSMITVPSLIETSSALLSTNEAKSILYDVFSSLAPFWGSKMYDIAIATSSLPNLIAVALVLFGATPLVFALFYFVGTFVSLFRGSASKQDEILEKVKSPYRPPTYLPSSASSKNNNYSVEEETQEEEYLDLRESKAFRVLAIVFFSIPLYLITKEDAFYGLFYNLSIKFGATALGNSLYNLASNSNSVSYVFTILVFSSISYLLASALIYGDTLDDSENDAEIVTDLAARFQKKFTPTILVAVAVALAVSAPNKMY